MALSVISLPSTGEFFWVHNMKKRFSFRTFLTNIPNPMKDRNRLNNSWWCFCSAQDCSGAGSLDEWEDISAQIIFFYFDNIPSTQLYMQMQIKLRIYLWNATQAWFWQVKTLSLVQSSYFHTFREAISVFLPLNKHVLFIWSSMSRESKVQTSLADAGNRLWGTFGKLSSWYLKVTSARRHNAEDRNSTC